MTMMMVKMMNYDDYDGNDNDDDGGDNDDDW